MITIYADKTIGPLQLGQAGENLTRSVIFDTCQWQLELEGGTAELLVMRQNDEVPYPAVLEAVPETPGSWAWTVTMTDTAVPGRGQIQLNYLVNGRIAKSRVYKTQVSPSLSEPGPVPPAEQAWVDQVLEAGAAAEEAVRHAPQINDGTWQVWDPTSGTYVDTGVAATEPGPQGEAGPQGGSDIVPFTVTLTPNGWSGNAQTVQSELFRAEGYFYNVYPSDLIVRYGIMAQDITADGQMQFTCDTVPGEPVTVEINRYQYNTAPTGGGATQAYVAEKDAETLAAAKKYTDGLLGGIRTLVGGGF